MADDTFRTTQGISSCVGFLPETESQKELENDRRLLVARELTMLVEVGGCHRPMPLYWTGLGLWLPWE